MFPLFLAEITVEDLALRNHLEEREEHVKYFVNLLLKHYPDLEKCFQVEETKHEADMESSFVFNLYTAILHMKKNGAQNLTCIELQKENYSEETTISSHIVKRSVNSQTDNNSKNFNLNLNLRLSHIVKNQNQKMMESHTNSGITQHENVENENSEKVEEICKNFFESLEQSDETDAISVKEADHRKTRNILEFLLHRLEIASSIILSIFCLEIIIKIYCMGLRKFLGKKLEVNFLNFRFF